MLHLWAAGGPLDTFYERHGRAEMGRQCARAGYEGRSLYFPRKTSGDRRFYIIYYLLDVPGCREADWHRRSINLTDLTEITFGHGLAANRNVQKHEKQRRKMATNRPMGADRQTGRRI